MTFWIVVAFGVGATIAVAVEIWYGWRQERMEHETVSPAGEPTETAEPLSANTGDASHVG